MSSPNTDANGSQGRAEEVSNDTPTTTPPAPPFETDSPAPEPQNDEMEVDNEDINEDEPEDLASITLPLSKIKRIFKMDPDYYGSSQSAVFATGAATELFIQYFTEQAAFLAKMDKRKKILYKDFSGAVAAQDSLHFLSDTVPKVVPLRNVLKESDAVADTNTEPANEPEPQPTEAPEPAKPSKKVDILSMLPISGNTSSPDQQPVKKATINDLVSNEEGQNETITID